MSEYTPTTDEVRDSYRYSNQRPDICGKDFGIEFDRWLEAVKAQAWDEGHSAGEENAGIGIASLLTGLEAPEIEENPYRKEQKDE